MGDYEIRNSGHTPCMKVVFFVKRHEPDSNILPEFLRFHCPASPFGDSGQGTAKLEAEAVNVKRKCYC